VIKKSSQWGFTLIELLIVIGIIGILAVIIVLLINPQELLRRSRDSNRLSDLAVVNKALSIFSTDVQGGFFGNASTTYISIPDPTATSTAGDQCQGLGLPSLSTSTGWSYHCASPSTYRKADGTGWLPVNLGQISAGSPVGTLPVDPINTTSSSYYYAYVTDGSSQWLLTALPESQKQKTAFLSMSPIRNYPGVIAQGNNFSLSTPLAPSDLVGYWNLDEGTGLSALDQSGNGNTATLSTINWPTSGCKIGNCLQTAGSAAQSAFLSPSSILFDATQITYMFWQNAPSFSGSGLRHEGGGYANAGTWGLYALDGADAASTWGGTSCCSSYTNSSLSTNVWYQIAVAWDNNTKRTLVYINGQRIQNISFAGNTIVGGGAKSLRIGEYVSGVGLDDIRIYNRVLSDGEILGIYNAEK